LKNKRIFKIKLKNSTGKCKNEEDYQNEMKTQKVMLVQATIWRHYLAQCISVVCRGNPE